jgi:hypothetical protein
MTISLHGDDVAVEQAAKQLYRLIDVLKVQEVTAEPVVAQELALVKIRATDANRAEVLKLVELSKGRVVDLAGESVMVFFFGLSAAALHGAAYYGLRSRKDWGWITAVIVSAGWSLVVVGIPVLVFLLPALLGRPPFGFLPLLLNSLLLLLN